MTESAVPGPGVDRLGQAVVDPTQNVLDLVEAAVKRLDDLREADSVHIRELMEIRAGYEAQIRDKESARLDAIRTTDQGNVSRAAEVAAAQATVLAAQLVANAEQARAGVTIGLEPVQKDIQDLRKAQYEAQGVKATTGENAISTRAVIAIVVSIVGLLFVMFTTLISLSALALGLYLAFKP